MQRICALIKRKIPRKGSVLKQWFMSYLFVLILPILIIAASFFGVRNLVTGEIVRANEAALVTLQASIDSQLYQGQTVVSNLLIDHRLRDVIRRSNTQQDIVETQGELIGLLWNYSSAIPGIDILVYIHDLDYIITPKTAQPLSYLSRSIAHANRIDVQEEEWRRLLADADGNYRYITSSRHSYLKYGQNALVYSADNSQAVFSNCYYTQLFVSLQYDSISGLLDVPEGSAIILLDDEGLPLASFGQELEFFTAPHIQEGETYRVMNIGNKRYIYTYLDSDATGLTCAMLTPYSDFWQSYHTLGMLVGICIALSLLAGLLAIVAVVRRNYRPVRSVLDLLRPEGSQVTASNEFDMIRERLYQIADNQSAMESSCAKQQRLLRENYLYSVLMGNKRHLADDDIMESLQISMEGRLFYPISIFPVNIQDSRLAFIRESAPDKEGAHKVALSFLLDNVLDEILEGQCGYYKIDIEDTATFVFLPDRETLEQQREAIHQALWKLCDAFAEHFRLELKVVLGREADLADDLSSSYKEMMAVHLYQYTAGDTRMIRAEQLDYHSSRYMLQLEEYASIIMESVLYGTFDDALSVAEAFFEELNGSGDLFHIARYHVFGLVDKLVGNTARNRADVELNTLLERLALCKTMPELKKALVSLLQLLCPGEGEAPERGSRISTKVEKYVQVHFADSSLSLTSIADAMGLSVKYLSKLFKMETGQGLLNYINTVRIHRARELLAAGCLSINDACEKVGYTNLKTFRRAFKKVEGVNPSEYRMVAVAHAAEVLDRTVG